MNSFIKDKCWIGVQIALFAVLLYCALLPVRIFLIIATGIMVLVPYSRRYWLWGSVVLTAYVFLFFSPQVMRVSGMVGGEIRRLMIPLPEVVKKSAVENPVVSIVIPAYNYEALVAYAVETAATQNFKYPYEVVVVDDGSTDNTLAEIMRVAQKYPHVAVYHHQQNRGLITNKNSGIAAARGEWIYNLDADDYLAPDALATLYSLTDKEDGGDFVFSADESFGKEQHVNYYCYGANTLNYNCVPNRALFRKSDWQKLGPYDYWFQKGVEDWDFAMAFKHAKRKIVMAERPIYFALSKDVSRNVEANRHVSELWWYMQAKYADMLTLKQRVEVLWCGFYRFYCNVAIGRRFKDYKVLYKIVTKD